MTKLLIQGTHGRENAEKATLPFIMANVAATADQEVAVLLTSDAVWLVTDGYADDIESDGLPNLGQLIKECVDNGAAIWACGACTGPRGITPDGLIEGASVVTAPNVIETMAAGVTTASF